MPKYTDDDIRRVSLEVSIGGHLATSYLEPYVLDFSFTDNSSSKADEISITLHDRDNKWQNEWMPRKGTQINASFICYNWINKGETLSLPCGAFKIDEVTFSGPPTKVQIKALSANLVSGIRDEKHTKAWENYSLEGIASEIANKNNLAFQYIGSSVKLNRQDQREESDLAFVQRIAKERGFHVKVHNNKLILFDYKENDARAASYTVSRLGNSSPQSFSFKSASSQTSYTKAEVAYTDPDTGTTHTAQVQSDKKSDSEKNLIINERVESLADAERVGKSELENKNKSEETGKLEMMGNPYFRAGNNVELTGFGEFDGKWAIDKATHKVSGKYVTSLEIRKISNTKYTTQLQEVKEVEGGSR